jgi:hypothetical protein
MSPDDDREVRIVYHRESFESAAGHQVRTKLEATVCDFLMKHRIAHRHGSEIFTVRMGVSGSPTIYVPDIILHDRDASGKTIIIEPFDAYSPKVGSTRIIAHFRKEMQKDYFVIVVARKQHFSKVQKRAYDMLVDFDRLEGFEKHLPGPPL